MDAADLKNLCYLADRDKYAWLAEYLSCPSVNFNADDEIFYGKIEGINDLVTFGGESVKKLKQAFEDAVEDYLQLCEQVGKPALKSYKGSFNVRIPQELHRQMVQKALMSGISLNQLVQKALEKEVSH